MSVSWTLKFHSVFFFFQPAGLYQEHYLLAGQSYKVSVLNKRQFKGYPNLLLQRQLLSKTKRFWILISNRLIEYLRFTEMTTWRHTRTVKINRKEKLLHHSSIHRARLSLSGEQKNVMLLSSSGWSGFIPG